MAVVPDPHKLFLPDPDYVPPFWTGKFFTTFMTALGFGSVCANKLALRQPIFSGIQMHIGVSALCFGFGVVLQKWYDDRNMERDAVYKHYIELHPEDFPMPERKKVGEVFPKFTPIR